MSQLFFSRLFPQLFPSPRPRYTLIPERLNGSSRILVPVAANIALATWLSCN